MRFIAVLLLFVSGFSFGQIQITESDFADGGDTIRMSMATDPTIDYASTGTNYTWDFSTLLADEQILRTYYDISDGSALMTFVFGIFAPTDYQGTNFTETDAIPLDQLGAVLPVSISNMNVVSKNTATEINSIGYSMVVEGTEIPFKSDTIETRYELPLDYGDVYSSIGYTMLDLNPIQDAAWIQHRQRSSNVDGWGSITTPFGTFDALRVRHDITELDSLYIGTFGTWIELPIPPSVIYEWWAIGELEPVLRISTSDILGTSTVTGIEYKDIYLGLDAGLDEQTLEIGMYPNPTQDLITFEGAGNGASYTIVNELGKSMQSGLMVAKNNQIDISSLAKGSYHVIIRSQDGQLGSSTFIKQ
ncbi:MAG: hypothetical protein ACI865_001915 [Flavobacteriaceae bacterium]|jgi:hypothetical protein